VRLPDAAGQPHGAVIALTGLLLLSATAAQGSAGPDIDQAEAESRLSQVLEEIGRAKTRLESARTQQREQQERLKELDLRIQQASRELHSLQEQQADQQRDLAALQRQRAEFLAQLDQRMDQLAEQLRWSYRSSRQSRIKLVLNQDNPALLGRMLAYYDYYARGQAERITLLREALTKLETMQQAIDLQLARLSQLAAEQGTVLDQLGTQREQRQGLLAQLAGQIGDEATRLHELERDRQDLEALIEQLTNVLADIPPDLGSRASVEKQKGRLPMPLQGPVRNAFGQNRSGGLRWQGWLIGAEAGTEARAIAYGRVAFADWLRGYGLLIIIDHGQGYMSLYGHNESLLREAGAWVEPGDTISIVGSNSGSSQGLYFELRKGGKAIDPAGWMAR
jgi:septal ring factor EnvC (AmiA/AmiB activator)